MRLKAPTKPAPKLTKQPLYRKPELLKSNRKVTFKEFGGNQTPKVSTEQKFTLFKVGLPKHVRASIETPLMLDIQNAQATPAKPGPPSRRRKAKLSWNADDIRALRSHLALTARSSRKISHKRLNTQPAEAIEQQVRKTQLEMPKMERMKYRQCCKQVDEVYDKIAILVEIGYNEKKIAEWVQLYSQAKCSFIKHVFLRTVTRGLFSPNEEFVFENNRERVKELIVHKVSKGAGVESFVKASEIAQLGHYFDTVISEKHCKKAQELKDAILDKLDIDTMINVDNKSSVFLKKQPTEVFDFLVELNSFQEQYGSFKSFAKINKQRFLELKEVEEQLRNTYQDMLENEDRQLLKKTVVTRRLGAQSRRFD